jgi:glycosyltransferase 2 family protein
MNSPFGLSWGKLAQYGFMLLLAAGLFWYLYRDQNWSATLATLANVRLGWVAAAIGAALWAHWLRAARWGLMLGALGHRPSTVAAFLAVLIGYLANLLLPRMGELTRSFMLERLAGVPFKQSFGAVITERVVDLLMLALALALALALEHERLLTLLDKLFGAPQGQGSGRWWGLAALAGAGLLGLALVWQFWAKLSQWALVQKAVQFGLGVKDGLLSVRQLSPAGQVQFGLYSVSIWLLYFFALYWVFFTLPITSGLTYRAGLSITAISGLSFAVPVQGGTGVYHYLVSETLLMYDLPLAQGRDFALVSHTVSTLVSLLSGLVAWVVALFWRPAVPGLRQNGTIFS